MRNDFDLMDMCTGDSDSTTSKSSILPPLCQDNNEVLSVSSNSTQSSNSITEEIWMFKVTIYPNNKIFMSKPWCNSRKQKQGKSKKNKKKVKEVKINQEEIL